MWKYLYDLSHNQILHTCLKEFNTSCHVINGIIITTTTTTTIIRPKMKENASMATTFLFQIQLGLKLCEPQCSQL
jgi:hypothetical protein